MDEKSIQKYPLHIGYRITFSDATALCFPRIKTGMQGDEIYANPVNMRVPGLQKKSCKKIKKSVDILVSWSYNITCVTGKRKVIRGVAQFG